MIEKTLVERMRAVAKIIGLIWILVSLMFAQSSDRDSLQSEIRLRTYLEKDQVPLNQEVVFNVELSWIGEIGRYRILELSEPVLTNLKLRGSGSANRFYRDENKRPHAIKSITFYFTPLEMGMAYIDGITIKYQDTQTGKSGRLISQRIGVEITEPVDRPGEKFNAVKLIVFALIAAFLALVLFSLKRYFEQKKQQELLTEPQKTLEEEFLEKLKNNVELSKNLPEKKFNDLVELLIHYFRRRFELPLGSEFFEIRLALEKVGVSQEILSKLEQLFERAELVKFAGEPVNEGELHFFIDTTELLLTEMNKKD